MTTEKEINEIFAREMKAMNDSEFPEPLPDWLLDNFEKIIMETPQKDCPYFADTVRCILHKKPNSLTFYEGGFVLNLLTATKPKFVGKDIKQFLDRKGQIEHIIARYNKTLRVAQNKIELKRNTQMKAIQPRILTHQQ